MTLTIGVLGANGFIGSRLVEMLHLGEMARVRPIVRTAASLARSSRFEVDARVADACDRRPLIEAFKGCDVVVHAIAGDQATILGSVAPVYEAASATGVRRLVYLSTATVHGQSPAPGTTEASPLNPRQSIAYNNSKIRAEQEFMRLRRVGQVELVLLRPGIVFGPRSFWIAGLADQLLARTAYLVDGGAGICNAIYVDNLVHGIHRAAVTPAADGEAFFLNDPEDVTWLEFYRPIVEAFGMSMVDVADVSYAPREASIADRIEAMRLAPPVQFALQRLPRSLKRGLHAAYATWRSPSTIFSPWARPGTKPPAVATEEIAFLHRCRVKLPTVKAERILGLKPIVAFDEAMRRSIAWLAFAGYPVLAR